MATRIRNGQAIPSVLRYLAPIVAWTIASIALGIVLGFSAVILPPMGAFGIVVVAGLVLLRVMPDLPLVSPGIIRKAFFFVLIAYLIIPFYYTLRSVLRLGRIGAGFPNQQDFDSICCLGGEQQEMAKAYSQDLRDHVIDAVKRAR